ncbi:signal peptidase II [Paenibacillus sp. Marseille-Q4541]|uniref:signal peptidase II n=1 Tax=Paenibacillus sp. Marseille-Q4541 TaxID=2831522 RepID=UPI001BA4DC40|nr:signal peptidase II [Paenibacillus sp. Marseille-Q4541]
MLFYFSAFLIILLDQLSKWWVRHHMAISEVIPIGGLIHEFRHYENSGMAFSLFQGYARLFGVVALIFISLVLYYRYKGEIHGRVMNVGAGLLVGGAAGNMIDRFWHGTVTDFIVFSDGGGILNLADIALNLGVLLFIAGMILNHYSSREKKRKYP